MAGVGRILAATDFSGAASAAVRRAARLAHDLQAELHVAHVVEERLLDWLRVVAPGGGLDAEPPGVVRARTHLEELARLLGQQFSIRTATHVAIGVPHATIAAQARAVGADLLVVGAHGLHTYREVFLGSTASRVVRLAAGPVLVVRKAVEDVYQGALVATDFSARAARAIELALVLAPSAYVEVLHVVELPPEGALGVLGFSGEALSEPREHRLESARVRLSALLVGVRPTARLDPVVEAGRPAQVVLERATRMKQGLIVVGKQGESTREPGLLGEVAKHVVDDALCDVLVTD
jgi:nucleotide-binding universal stress UspA family protein